MIFKWFFCDIVHMKYQFYDFFCHSSGNQFWADDISRFINYVVNEFWNPNTIFFVYILLLYTAQYIYSIWVNTAIITSHIRCFFLEWMCFMLLFPLHFGRYLAHQTPNTVFIDANNILWLRFVLLFMNSFGSQLISHIAMLSTSNRNA